MNGVLTEIVSLAGGVVTGLALERRASRRTVKSNESLEQQVSALRTRIFTLNGRTDANPTSDSEGLPERLTQRALTTQDAGGRVDTRALVAYFVEHAHTPDEVETVINSLCQAGIAREEGAWLQMI